MTRSLNRAKVLFPAMIALVPCAARYAYATAPETPSFVGVWKGTSVCQIKDSPCQNELGVYTMKKLAADRFEFSMNKVVNGEEQNMGSLSCVPGTAGDELVCRQNEAAVWTWKLKGDSMTGTLIYHGRLYRDIRLTRAK